jgi:hypothetical protein
MTKREQQQLDALRREMEAWRSACPGGETIRAIDRWADTLKRIVDHQ